ncbi:MAG: hypothetical protein ACERLM_11695 [Acidimicrobiales bacterium]
MKRFVLILVTMAMLVVTASAASAAPKPTDLDGNHPVYPNICVGGALAGDEPVFGLGVILNGGSHGALPTAAFYPFGDLSADPIVAVSMYRVISATPTDPEGLAFEIGESRGGGNGNKAPDLDAADVTAGVDRVMSRWDVTVCSTPSINGALLAELYPDGIFGGDDTYVFTNYLK